MISASAYDCLLFGPSLLQRRNNRGEARATEIENLYERGKLVPWLVQEQPAQNTFKSGRYLRPYSRLHSNKQPKIARRVASGPEVCICIDAVAFN